MFSTKLLYLENTSLMRHSAIIVGIMFDNDKHIVILDQTIFYPQGGGQPYDKGIIEGLAGKFIVDEVRFVDGIVKHIGRMEHGTFASGNTVTCTVDQARRVLNSRLHSAGHVIDLAVKALGLQWIPGKGFHFSEGPYVEYSVTNAQELDKEKLKNEIEAACAKLISENPSIKTFFTDKARLSSCCDFVPDYIPADKPIHVVKIGDVGVPCGGTHVANVAELQKITIRKIKCEGNTVRLSYDIIR